jgi:hypothetical protein
VNGRGQERFGFWSVLIAIDMAIWAIFPPIPWKYHLAAAGIAFFRHDLLPWIVERTVRAWRYAELRRQRREAREN